MAQHEAGYARGVCQGKEQHMTDRELLKLAAKAAGIHIGPDSPWSGYSDRDGFYTTNMDGSAVTWRWNPIADDGDALRLAVKLRMNVFHAAGKAYALDEEGGIECEQGHETDPLAATRRAIVRAAAEIGRQMT
jgi:hypothetical protein